jgi:hypothetical protein
VEKSRGSASGGSGGAAWSVKLRQRHGRTPAMAAVTRTARRVREKRGRARVGRRDREARPVFIERGRGEGVGRERGGRILQDAIDGGCINGERVGRGETVALKLHYAEETNDCGTSREVARTRGLGAARRLAARHRARGGVLARGSIGVRARCPGGCAVGEGRGKKRGARWGPCVRERGGGERRRWRRLLVTAGEGRG